MNEFERNRGVDRIFDFGVRAAARAIDQQDKERPQPLAGAIDEVVGDFANQRFLRIEQSRKFGLSAQQVIANQHGRIARVEDA